MAYRPTPPPDDGELFEQQLAQEATRLFNSSVDAVDVDVADVREHGIEIFRFQTEDAILEHLKEVRSTFKPDVKSRSGEVAEPDVRRARYYLLEPPGYHWSHLPITYAGVLGLVSTHRIFPQISRYLSAFGRKSFPQDEGFAGFNSAETFDADGELATFESCYLLKFVAKRSNASENANPWSVRHALIYQKVDLAGQESNHVLVRLSEMMKSRLNKAVEETPRQFVRDWVQLHTMCFDSVDQEMRHYINYLDQEVREVFGRMLLSGIEPGKLNEYDTAGTSAKDMKTIQVLQDHAQRVSTIISLNMETIDCLSRHAVRLKKLAGSSNNWCSMLAEHEHRMQRINQEHRFSLVNISAVIQRAKAVSEQLRDTISVRNSEAAKVHAHAVVLLSEASSQETRVVKTLTVLATIFVPAGFVAEFLQMGYVSVVDGAVTRWAAEPGLLIYAILVIPLISLIMLVYVVVECRNRKERSKTAGRAGIV